MKNIFVAAIFLFGTLSFGVQLQAQKLKPYTIGAVTDGDIKTVADQVSQNLVANGIEVLGSYMPVQDPDRVIIAITSEELKSAVGKTGDLTGFALAWRVALTREEGKILVSYNTPEYWGYAYFRKDFKKVKDLYVRYTNKLSSALAALGEVDGTTFGSEDGLDPARLMNYRYKVLMPQFDDTQKLQEFDSFEDAVTTIDGNIASGIKDVTSVYSVEMKDKKLKLYGFGLSGENGEGKFMPKIDIANPKHTAFLPYELLVLDNEVHMLHGRFRIALSFPDLSLGQFMKIVSTPGDIEDLLKSTCRLEQ